MATTVNTLVAKLDASGMTAGAKQAEAATERVRKGAASLNRGLLSANSGFNRFAASARSFQSILGAGLGLFGLSQGIRSTIGQLASFERQFSIISAISRDLTNTQFRALREEAERLGATTEFTATQAAEGFVQLTRAGFSASESLGTIGSVLDLATVGAIGLNESSKILTTTIRQFGLDTSSTAASIASATRAADSLTVVSSSSNTGITELAQALKFVGPVANAFGISLEQTSAALGVLANAGVEASLAGTNLRGVISALVSPSPKASKALARLGADVSGLRDGSIDLTTTLAILGEAQLDAASALEIFGRRNAAAAIVLTRNIETIVALEAAQKTLAGETKRAAGVIRDDLQGALDTLKSSINATVLVLGERGLRNAIETTTKFLTELVRELAGLPSDAGRFTQAVDITAGALRGLALVMGAVIALKFATTIANIAGSLFGLIPAISAASRALLTLLTTNPFGLILLGVTAALVAFADFKTETLKVEGQAVSMGAVFKGVFTFIGKVAREIWAGLVEAGGIVAQRLGEAWESFSSYVGEVLSNINDNFGGVFRGIVEFLKRTVNVIIGLFVGMGRAIAGIFKGVFDGIATAASKTGSAIEAFTEGNFSRGTELLGGAFNAIAFSVDFKAAGAEFETAFKEDYVGVATRAIVDNGKAIVQRIRSASAAAEAEFKSGLDAINAELDNEIRKAQRGINRSEAAKADEIARLEAERDARLTALREEQARLQAKLVKDRLAAEAEVDAAIEKTGKTAKRTAESLTSLESALESLARAQEERLTVRSNLPLLLAEVEVQTATAQEVLVDSIVNLSQGIGDSVSTLATDLADSETTFRDAMFSFVTNIIDSAFQSLVANPLQSAVTTGVQSILSGIFTPAVGNATTTTAAVTGAIPGQNAAGSIFSGPTVLQTLGGPQIVAEGARKEALFPVVQDPYGRLAISSVPSGGEGTNVTVIQNISTPDERSFRRTQNQTFGALRRSLNQGRR